MQKGPLGPFSFGEAIEFTPRGQFQLYKRSLSRCSVKSWGSA